MVDNKFHFKFRKRFTIQQVGNHESRIWLFSDSLSPRSARTSIANNFSLEDSNARRSSLRMFIPRSIENSPLVVREQPESISDSHFWQFPALTERLAFERHYKLQPAEWNPNDTTRINTYLGLPWASYIDKNNVPDLVKQVFGVRLRGYRALSDEWGLKWGVDVAVHTVCQHIYWERMLPFWEEFGVTDVHLSHCEPDSAEIARPYGIRIHSWSLAAVNIVNPNRRVGLIIGKPLNERKYLASFIGAHMSNYRSDVRLHLRDEAMKFGESDVLVEVTDDWHFNPAVYQAQVAGRSLSNAQVISEREANVRYNSLLTNTVFSLCPEGAGPNTIRLWESLAVGSIPVVIVEDWIYPQVPGEDLRWEDCVIQVRRNEIKGLFDRLRNMKEKEANRLGEMQTAGLKMYERFEKMRCF